jgi:L-fuconolactonase
MTAHGATIPVIDAQVHAWSPDSPSRPWPTASREYLRTTSVLSSAERPPFEAAQLVAEMDRIGVDHTILVPPVFAGDDDRAALQAAQDYPDRFMVMTRLTLDERIGCAQMRYWPRSPAIVGVRLTFFWEQHRRLLDEGGAEWFWPVAEELGIPLAILSPGRLGTIGDIARRHPGLSVIVDHFGMDLEAKDAAALRSIDELVELAALPNVAVKASTLPSYVTEPYPFPSLRDPIRRVYDAFGPQRLFWGSEMTRLPVPYEQCLTHFTETLDFLSDDDLTWIMGRGIREWLRLPVTLDAATSTATRAAS